MPEWADSIPDTDMGWRHVTLTPKSATGANVRYSPLVLSNNVAGTIRTTVTGIANDRYVYSDDTYTWYPLRILHNPQFDNAVQVWVAIEAYVVTWGDYVNGESEFFDLAFLGQPTIRIPRAHMDSVVEVLHALANYLAAK
jgi:hypothetical protein